MIRHSCGGSIVCGEDGFVCDRCGFRLSRDTGGDMSLEAQHRRYLQNEGLI